MQVNQWALPRPADASAPYLPPHAPAGDPLTLARLPGSSVVKNLPTNSGDMDLIPSLGRFHMLWSSEEACRPQLLSLCSRARGAATTSPTCHSCRSLSAIELVLHNKKGQGEACTPERESSCRSPRLEKSPHGKEDPAQPKQTIKNFKKSCKLRQTRYGSHIHFSDSVFLRPFAIRKPNYANYCKLPILQSANTRTEMFLKINFTGFLYFPFF